MMLAQCQRRNTVGKAGILLTPREGVDFRKERDSETIIRKDKKNPIQQA